MARKVVTWLLALAGVGLTAGGIGIGVVENSWTAYLLLAVYEILVALLAFAGGIFETLRGRWQDRLTERIDVLLRGWFGGIERRYREYVMRSLRFIDVKGLATVGFYQPELNEVFVDVSLAHRAPGDFATGLVPTSPADLSDRHFLMDFLGHDQPRILAVVGVPGSGKTTLLRHTGRTLTQNRRKYRRNIPILLYLRDVAAAIAAKPESALPDALGDVLGDVLGEAHRQELRDWIERRLARGECTVLLDGLDEVGVKDRRGQVANWVDRQIQRYPGNDFVITSRPHGYRTAHIDGATVLQMRGFTNDQVTTFAHAWYLAVEMHSAYDTVAEAKERADIAARDLLERLNRSPALYDLTVNPLLLTMIANVHRYRGALPGSRARLYEEICQVMLWRREDAKQLSMGMGGDDKESLLRELAYKMMVLKERELHRDRVIELVEPGLQRMTTTANVRDFLANVASNGLLVERETDMFGFAHLTFQEYLASAYIREQSAAQVLADNVDEPWWRETTLLYVARSHGDAIVSACLRSGSPTALSLAFDCAEQGGQLAPELRARLNDMLTTALTPGGDAGLRGLITEVVVGRHLRDQVRTSTGGRVCVNPISYEIYDLFLQDTGAAPPDLQSQDASWPDAKRTPVTGVWRDDAQALLHWLNAVTREGRTYRLPQRPEIEDTATLRMLASRHDLGGGATSVWITGADRASIELWTPAGTAHPHTVDVATIADYARRDVASHTGTCVRLALLRARVARWMLAKGLRLMRERFARQAGGHSGRTPDLNLARGQVLDLAYDLRRTMTYVERSGTDAQSAPVLRRQLDRLRDIDRILERTLTPALLDQAANLTREFDEDLDRLREAIPGRAGPLDRAIVAEPGTLEVIDRLPVAGLDQTFEAGLGAMMGQALANALGRVLHQTDANPAWPAEFAQWILKETAQVMTSSYLVEPSHLAGRLDEVTMRLSQSLPAAADGAAAWARHAVAALREIGLPQFRRSVPGDVADLGAIRLAALCLATEAEPLGQPALSQALCEIAAGATLLERRVAGMSMPTERVVIAT